MLINGIKGTGADECLFDVITMLFEVHSLTNGSHYLNVITNPERAKALRNKALLCCSVLINLNQNLFVCSTDYNRLIEEFQKFVNRDWQLACTCKWVISVKGRACINDEIVSCKQFVLAKANEFNKYHTMIIVYIRKEERSNYLKRVESKRLVGVSFSNVMRFRMELISSLQYGCKRNRTPIMTMFHVEAKYRYRELNSSKELIVLRFITKKY